MQLTQFDFMSTFGLAEFEKLAAGISNFIFSNEEQKCMVDYTFKSLFNVSYEPSIDKPFGIDDVTDSPTIFAMFAASGWVVNYWFPKGLFTLSDESKKRVQKVIDQKNNLLPLHQG